ncbi:hypothetical protein [Methylobacterium aquaticum]|uniref:hypothetical protein n=1 Tax=Methylobacterium aquaticum TaxID=270351 RepID=UPI001932E73E|nr:hypothetical protein [Methylobacterium aquaticum]QRE77365.1 hypothetical protein F1D61_30995 [Methylobacterium aquaticum]
MSDLDAMLKRAAQHKMTPAEQHAQRRSWVIGQMMCSRPDMTREEAERLADGAVGPNLAARVAELEVENTRLREALEAAAHWHDSKRKSLGKQPPNADRDWRRTQHSFQAEEIRASLEVARPTAPATEQEEG